MKRIICLITTLVMIISACCYVAAAEETGSTQYGDAVEFVEAFDLMPFLNYESIDFNKEITRAEFARILCALHNANEVASGEYGFEDVDDKTPWNGYIRACIANGYMKGTSKYSFEPNRAIKMSEAIKCLLDAMGYAPKAGAYGGFPSGYMKIATELSILSGISFSDDAASIGEVAQLIYNCADAPVFLVDGVSHEYATYTENEDRTMMTEIMGVDMLRGVVEDNGITSLSGDTGISYGKLAVDGKTYSVREGFDATGFLGHQVIVYHTIEDKHNPQEEIVFIKIDDAKEKRAVTFELEDFINLSGNTIQYGDGNKVKEIKLGATPNVILNGKFEKSYDKSFFDFDYGTVTYLPAHGDYRETLIIEGFVSWYLSGVDKEKGIIYGSSNCRAIENTHIIAIDTNLVNEKIFIYDQYGRITDFDDIYTYTIVDISKNDDIIKILIPPVSATSKKVTKIVNASEGIVELDGEKWRFTKTCRESSDFEQLKIGETYLFFVNYAGDVAFIDYTTKPGVLDVGYMIASVEGEKLGENARLGVLTDANIVTVMYLADKVFLSDTQNEEFNLSDEEIVKKLNGYTGVFNFKTNASGEISKIYLPTDLYVKREKGRLGVVYESDKKSYYYENGMGRIDGNVVFDARIMAFGYYPGAKNEEEKYVYGQFQNLRHGSATQSVLKAYNFEPGSKYADYLFYSAENIEASVPAVYQSTLLMVREISKGLNKYDEETYYLNCYNFNSSTDNYQVEIPVDVLEKITSTSGDKKYTYEVKIGDILQCKIADNKILAAAILYRSDVDNLLNPETGKRGNILEMVEKYGTNPGIIYNPIVPGGISNAFGHTTEGRTLLAYIYSMDSKSALIYTTWDMSCNGSEYDPSIHFNEVMFAPTSAKLAVVTYSRTGVDVKIGTLADIRTFQEVGTECSRVLTVSRYGSNLHFILINGEMER